MAREIPQTSAGKERKVGKVMGEYKSGELTSSSGAKVTNPKQAVAIALSESGQSKSKGAKSPSAKSTTARLAKKLDQRIDARGR
jgi:hypothetical protein